MLIIGLALIGGGVFFARTYFGEKGDIAVKNSAYDTPAQNTLPDSDGDGLKDWEELLWGTDPRNPDTDSDGTSDGDEVKMGRDPLKPGPDDAFPELPPNENKENTYTQPETLTDAVGSYAAQQYLITKLQNGAFNPQELSQYLAQSLGSVTVGESDLYRHKDIIIVQNTDPEYLRKFALTTMKISRDIMQTDFPYYQFEEYDAATDRFQPHITIYQKTEGQLLLQEVPATYALQYLQLLNNTKKAKEALIAIKRMEYDPLLAIVGTLEFEKALRNITIVMTNTQQKLAADGVRFTQADITQMFGLSYRNE